MTILFPSYFLCVSVEWGYFHVWHDVLLCFLLWRKLLQTVSAILDVAFCMFTFFTYVYGFCIRLCMDFSHIVQLLHTYTAYILRKLCGFCVHIRILCALSNFCVRIRLIGCACCADFAYVYGLSSLCSMWTVLRYPILRVP